MSRKMRYTPAFSNTTTVHSKYQYDGLIDKDSRDLAKRMKGMWENTPAWKREIWVDKTVKGCAKARKKKTPDPKEREAAECRMVEALRAAVAMLEHHMVALQQFPGRDATKPVNQMAIHNALVLLKTKCGVKFDDDEFTHRVEVARLHLHTRLEPESGTEYDERMQSIERQRQERLAAIKRMTERLKARPK